MKLLKTLIFSSFLLTGCTPEYPLDTVSQVNIEKYMGTWYEIASFPTSFQKDCTATTATYTLNSNGSVGVFNKCYKNTLDGPVSSAEGTAYVDDTTTNAKLKVSFFWPFSGKYWIIDLASNYSYAVVGHPNREYLWILSRTPQMAPSTYKAILERVQAKGFNIQRLQKTLQPTPKQPI
jgi:apolipoprotein D and lipocalin family protein